MGADKQSENKTEASPKTKISGDGNVVSDAFVGSFQKLLDNRELTFQVLDMFPIPIEIFGADGTTVFFNRAGMELNGIKDASLIVGKYNVINDPVCNDQLGMRESIQRAFRGETVAFPDFSAPIQDLVDRGVIEEKPYETAIMDLFMYPVWDEDRLVFVVCVFIVRSMYQGKPDVAKAKEYIENHWRGTFDSEAVAKSVYMSVRQLYNLFKQHVGMTPGDYHNKCKIEHLKEKLMDKNLTIAEAFDACGEDSRGWIAKVFKKITGLSPKEYRASQKP